MLRRFLSDPPTHPFCAILGDPVSHSLSPRLHNEAFRLVGLPWSYHPIQVIDDELPWLPELFALSGFRGANVTVPHKVAVMGYVQRIDPLAEHIGAVNTIVPNDQEMVGFNTDMDGFLDPLKEFASELKGRDAMIFGSGGAQKAVRFALERLGMGTVRIVSRTPDPDDRLQIPYEDVAVFAPETTLFVNATPLGLPQHSGKSPLDGLRFKPKPHQIGYDLLYKPRITPFLEAFVNQKCLVFGGMDMFLGQAKRSFKLWTGMEMPEEAVDVLL